MRRAILVLVLSAGGCGGAYRVSAPGERVNLGPFTVDPQIPWNMASNKIWQDWTVDGFSLHEVSFVLGLKDGKALYPRLEQKENAPIFRKDMSPPEVARWIGSSLEFLGAKRLKKSEPAPWPFGSLAGSRVEIEYVDPADLEVQGFTVWATHEQKLYLIHYRGAKEYHFAKYKDAAERLIASIRWSR